MELKEAIYKRRSVRKFRDEHISRELIEEIIRSASWAPSACNNQLWRFVVVDDSKLKQEIVEEGGAAFIKDSPVGIIILYDSYTDNSEYSDNIQSAAAAVQNMLLTATSLGIGSCWVCQLPGKATLRRLLKIPKYFEPIAYVALGYSALDVKSHPRKNQLSEIASWNKFDFKIAKPKRARLKLRSIIRKAYFSLPLALKKALRPIAEKFVKKFEN